MLENLRLSAGQPPALDLERYTVKPDRYNTFIPHNVNLIPGGLDSDGLPHLYEANGGCATRQRPDPETILVEWLKAALRRLPGDWKVFFDTDGDLSVSPFTRVVTHLVY